MKVKDRIWGEFDVQEKVLQELFTSPQILRLKKIAQFGLPYEYYPLPGFNRYEHSVGVMLLIRKLNGSLEEQIAGLTHDVSHTAFSHLVDWVIGDRKDESFQDNRHLEVMLQDGIASLLRRYGFSPESLADYEKYKLLEQPAPALCADRVDYAIREFKDWANPSIVNLCVNEVRAENGRIVFASHDSALEFARSYMKLQREHWGGAEWMLRWQLFSEVLKHGLKKKIVNLEDFTGEDSQVLDKLQASGDERVINELNSLRGALSYRIIKFGERSDYLLHKKFRFIDPKYIENDEIKLLSESDSSYRELLEHEQENNKRGIAIVLDKL